MNRTAHASADDIDHGANIVLLREAFATAVRAAQPENYLKSSGLVERVLALGAGSRIYVVGAGKGSAGMAAALERDWPLPYAPPGLVVARDGYKRPTKSIEVIEAGHPCPDDRNPAAARRMADYLRRCGADDYVIMLVSGGGSSLLSSPVNGVSIDAFAELTRRLMARGVGVKDLNIVRKHLTTQLGGKLARAAFPARVDALILSDVVGDDPTVIASGPVSPDPSTLADARRVIEQYAVPAEPAVLAALADPANETPKPGDPVFTSVRTTVIPSDCWMDPVEALLHEAGYTVRFIDRNAEGDARDLAIRHAALAKQMAGTGRRVALVSGGEATVRVRGEGAGGPNTEYALQLALSLKGCPETYAVACDTDGTDGSSAAAGAVVRPDTLTCAASMSLDAAKSLGKSDSGGFFVALGDALISGPTFTNVNDMRVILIGA